MSRRTPRPVPHPTSFDKLSKRRLRVVCTGGGKHKPMQLGAYWVPAAPGRPDLQVMLQGTPAPVLTPLNALVLEWPCKTCGRIIQRSETWLREAVLAAPRDGVLTCDVSM